MFELFKKVKEKNPLVLHYTNEVTINDCANITLALGASPLMSYSYDEIEELVNISSAVVINIGTMTSSNIDLFIKAGKACNKLGKRVVLDPVGVFASKARIELTNKLLNEVKFDVVKGNIAEVKFIGGFDVRGKGVDSFDDGEDISSQIKKISKKLDCIVAATGKVDFVSDGTTVLKILNGTSKLKSVTGTGCMTGSLIGSFLGTEDENKLNCTAMGILTMGLCGELADKDNIGIGSFKVSLMDNVYKINEETLKEFAKINITK